MLSRRQVLALFSLPIVGRAATPAQSAGPFYPPPSMRSVDTDADLVRVEGQVQEAGGELMYLYGTVRNAAGTVMPGAQVEIWQCDVNGRYVHTGDRHNAPRDLGFQGFGISVANAQGEYAFRTIKPVSYPGRTPHIHVKVVHQQRELISQLYLADDPNNAYDGLFLNVPVQAREDVLMHLRPTSGGWHANVNLCL